MQNKKHHVMKLNRFTSNNGKFFLLVALMASACIPSCRRPDQAGPNDNWCTSGVNILTIDDANVPAAIKTQIYAAPASYTAVGSANYNASLPLIIIPFQFNTEFPQNTTVTTQVIRDNFFTTGTGSVRDYFSENSWGQYNIREGWIANTVTLSNNPAFYGTGQLGNDWTRNPAVAREICQNSNVDWSAIDANGNGTISRNEAQICFLLSAGGGGATRPSNITISTQTRTYNINASFVYFDCKTNADPTRGTDAIRYNYSTIWHELAHGMFGLPDRYSDFCGSGRTGQYDLMSDNCSWRHMSMYDKMKIGWIRPKILVKPSQRADRARHCYTFPNSETTPAAVILWDQNQPNEYWIVENRHKPSSPRGFDRDLPESGLAVWWVDDRFAQLSLIDARDVTVRPNMISYNATLNQQGALFKNRTGATDATFNMQFFRSSVNSTEMGIRAPSPEGATMFVEF
jgi:M6 family metalloprotease-like protein